MNAGAILVAAGSGERLRAPIPKAYVELGGRPLLSWAFASIDGSGLFDEVVIVVGAGDFDRARAVLPGSAARSSRLVAGGARRQDSVQAGLAALAPEIDLVAVHDVARPFATEDLIGRVVRRAREAGAAVAALRVSDTVHRVDAEGRLSETLARDELRLAQTPQAFHRELLERAHDKARAEGREETDDAALVAALGVSVWVEEGEVTNRKITVPEDLALAQAWLRSEGFVGTRDSEP